MTATTSLATPPPSPAPAPETSTTTGARSRRPIALGLLVPGLLGLGITFVLPLLWLVRMSLNRGGSAGAIEETVTLDTYLDALTDSFTWELTLNTLRLGVLATVLTVAVSYPVALFLSRTPSRFRGVLVALAIAPLLTSQVVRTYGWLVLLGDQGVINGLLLELGLIETPLSLAYNYTGAVIALVEILMPYAILAMLSGFGRVSIDLEQAAGSLGANRWKVFWRITLPLSMPGVLTAALLVFVLTISSFITPSLVGGGKVFVLATEIYTQAKMTLNWPLAATLSIFLLALFSLLIAAYLRAVRRLER
ncbi:MAG: ABC transporter permease [Actinomycetota bacterium]|nr:ABC transporter permease [Actinomycetota bacterium]